MHDKSVRDCGDKDEHSKLTMTKCDHDNNKNDDNKNMNKKNYNKNNDYG